MQNVAIIAAVPVKPVQVVSDGKSAISSGHGFLRQLLGVMTDETGQPTGNLNQADTSGLVPEAAEEAPEQTRAAAISGTLAMLLTLPVQLTVQSVTEATGHTSVTVEGSTLVADRAYASGSDLQVSPAEVLNLQGKTSDKPEAEALTEEAGLAAAREVDGATQPTSTMPLTNSSGATVVSAAEPDMPAVQATKSPALVVASKPGKPGSSQVDDIVAHLWKRSLITRQQATRSAPSGECANATEPEQAMSRQGTKHIPADPALQTGLAIGAPTKPSVETAPLSAAAIQSEKRINPKGTDLQLVGDAEQEGEGTLGEHKPALVSLKSGQQVSAIDSRPTAQFADSLKGSLEISAKQAGQVREERVSPETDLADFSGLQAVGPTDRMDSVQPQVTGPSTPSRAWPTPHEQVLRGLETGIRQLQTFRAGDRTTVKLQLFPEELGEVRVKLELVGQTVTAQFEASSTTTASLLKDGLPALRQALDSQGFSDVSLTAGFAGDFGQAGGRRDEQAPRQHQGHARLQRAVPVAAGHETEPRLATARLDYKL